MKAISIRKDNPAIDYEAIVSFIGREVYFDTRHGKVYLKSSSCGDVVSYICTVSDWREATAPVGGPFSAFSASPAMLETCEIRPIGDHIVFHTPLNPLTVPCLSSSGTQVQDA